MEQERNEVYERIPWDTLEDKKADRPWLMYGLAVALVLGALAYSFMSNRPAPAMVATTVPAAASQGTAAAPVLPPVVSASPSTSPVVAAEADLFAVHPERVMDRVAALAEWFVAEYLTVDGSEEGKKTLAALLPAGVPLPVAPEGKRVFVEWVRTTSIEERGALVFAVSVLARSLVADGDGAYQRQPPLELTLEVAVETDMPRITMPPVIRPAEIGSPHQLALAQVPDEVESAALDLSGGSEVVGGLQTESGEWRVVVLAPGPDGVSRPVTVSLP